MKKAIVLLFVSCLSVSGFASSSMAADGWESNLKVTSGNVESNLSFGEMSDATDLTDGLYEVPAMLSGALQAYFQNTEGFFWRDIRSLGSHKVWQLFIASQTGYPVTLTWAPEDLPAEGKIMLIDKSSQHETDMKNSSTYTLDNPNEASLFIKASYN